MKNKSVPSIGLVIGRFQPFHNAHLKLLQFALSKYNNVIVLVGSYRQARDIHNPFLYEERENMILSSLEGEERARVLIRPVRDYKYNDNLWISEVQRIVDEITEEQMEVHLVGHNRDSSSSYLKMFPQWQFHESGRFEDDISATEIRTAYMQQACVDNPDLGPKILRSKLPEAVVHFMEIFSEDEDYGELVEEFEFINKYKAAWKQAPYKPIFVTVDGICIKSGHVLLVRRKSSPGKNLLAFPGGYVQQEETLLQGMLRELKEETAIGVTKDLLQKSIVAQHVFDSPLRDLRGRVITHSFFMDLGSGVLPKVRGGDDAKDAMWLPLHEALANDDAFFADHWDMLNWFIFRSAQ